VPDLVQQTLETVSNGAFTDLSDLLANARHFCARAGIDPNEVWADARRAAEGDMDDGPEAVRDPTRFPSGRTLKSSDCGTRSLKRVSVECRSGPHDTEQNV
jgi:hypothetical protein